MTTTINASTSAGLVNTADTSGILQLQTASTAALTIDASQNTTLAGTLTTTGITNSGVATATRFNPTGSSVTGNGMYLPAANSLGLSTNGTNAVYIDSSQNVGIGTTSPSAKLDITNGGIKVSTGGYNLAMQGSTSSGTLNGLFIAGVPRVTDDTGTFENTYIGCGASVGNIIFQQGNSSTTSSNTERARIDSGGSFFLNCTSSPTGNSTGTGGIGLKVTSGDAFNMKHDSNGSNTFNIWQTGTNSFQAFSFCKGSTQTQVGSISCTTTGTGFNTTSDYRLKNTIAPMTGALAKVALLKPVTYKWKVDGSDGEGFIAHELQEIVPDCVTGEKDAVDAKGNPVYQGIDVSFLVATLTAAIQELKAINDTQAETINALTARIVALEAK